MINMVLHISWDAGFIILQFSIELQLKMKIKIK